MNPIKYPYLPEGREILYVPSTNPFMAQAAAYALEHSLDKAFKTASVVVKDHMVIGIAANGSDYHLTHECERVKRGLPTGEGYELCEGCHPKNHSEPKAIKAAQDAGHDTNGADVYLWGHWWTCEGCWKAIIDSGIRNLYLMEGSERFFDKNAPEYVHGNY